MSDDILNFTDKDLLKLRNSEIVKLRDKIYKLEFDNYQLQRPDYDTCLINDEVYKLKHWLAFYKQKNEQLNNEIESLKIQLQEFDYYKNL